ncbi:uncharacterized protein LOC131680444 [Topomyia yanbarensis]|uniref:uncharacterized protein LOC131680444 n=1 Tax=Topomyia yanbarensis TaxID=2498891 RepID=UPI00273CA053|nr:uncharacterized protein LOC131680444 [Topomyia yanbarensis]
MAKLREQSKVLNVTTNSILAIEKFINGFDAEHDCDKIDSRVSRLDQLFERYISTSINVELLTNDGAETMIDFTKQRDEMEEKYYLLRDFLLSHKPNNNRSAAMVSAPVSSVVRLPKIDLPTFDGDINNWIPFRDAYTALIHRNNDLQPVDKFHYFMAALKGPVRKLLDIISITADNYKVAWDLLVGRYDNKRLFIKNHISDLFAIESVRKESSDSILSLVDQFERHVKILTALGESTNSWSSLLVHMVCARLDKHTLREWEKSTGDIIDEIPTYEEIIHFLHEQARILHTLNSEVTGFHTNSKEKPRFSVAHTATIPNTSTYRCAVCSQPHRIYECEEFKRKSVEQKHEIVRRKKLCWNCLSSSHMSRDCPSKPCRKCNEKHHTLLHQSSLSDRYALPQSKPTTAGSQPTTKGSSSDSFTSTPSATFTQKSSSSHSPPSEIATSQSRPITSRPVSNAMAASCGAVYTTVLLSTAVVRVFGPTGKVTFARTLLDSCSEANFITERIVQLLGLKRTRQSAIISGMGGSTVKSVHNTVASFSSVDSSYSQTLTFSILPKITNDLPARPVDTSRWKIPFSLVLADPDFASPQKIDMVIGAQLFFTLLRDGQLSIADGPGVDQPLLQRTVLGWIVSGPVSQEAPCSDSTNVALLCTSDHLDQQLAKFWEIESCPDTRGLSKEELACEKYFTETTTRDESGRFVVRLPKKEDVLSQLGDSESTALRRFHWLQRRLAKNPDLKGQYCDFMHEYLALGHMIPVDSLPDNTHPQSYFLPHHAVIKPTSTTTKCRVVFDGSSKSSTGISLNDCLMVGPTVQETLYSIVIRIRIREIALVADITKMYRQIWIHPHDSTLQRIFWQHSTDSEVRPYELTTVTYGTASAPYLATRCLQQLSFDYSQKEDDAAAKIGKDFYVDDFLSGALTKPSIFNVKSRIFLASQGLS